MELVTTSPGAFNFQTLLDRLPRAKQVVVTTYSLGKCETNPVLKILRSLPAQAHLTLITGLPNRTTADKAYSPENPHLETEAYIAALDPKLFSCAIESWFCLDNHSKIIIADHVAYVGSANLTAGSKGNFEAGLLTEDEDDVDCLLHFVEQLKNQSIPLFSIQGRRELQMLLEFASLVPIVIESLQTQICDWRADVTGDGEYVVVADRFEIPASIANSITTALITAQSMQAKGSIPKSESLIESIVTQLQSLSSSVRSVQEGRVLPHLLDESAVRLDLAAKYLHLSAEGRVDRVVSDAIEEEWTARSEKNQADRQSAAEAGYDQFKNTLAELKRDITRLLKMDGLNEGVRFTKQKYKS